jgi:hypothetical protein
VIPSFSGFLVPQSTTPPPVTTGFEFWTDGTPVAVTVSDGSMTNWVEGQPVEQEVG